MAHSSLGGIIRGLWLWYIHNRARHAADHDDATRRVSFHQVLRNCNGIEVGAVHINSPKLLHAVVGVISSIIILSEASRSHQSVNFAMGLYDFGQGLVDGCWAGYIAEVSCNLWDPGLCVSAKNVKRHAPYLSAPGFSALKVSMRPSADF